MSQPPVARRWRPSMRRRLWIYLFLTVMVALAVNSSLGIFIARHEVDEVFDAHLVTTTRVLKGMITRGHITDEQELHQTLTELFSGIEQVPSEIQTYEKKILIQLWSVDGRRLLYRSPQSPDYALAPLHAGLHYINGRKDHWQVFVTQLDDLNVWLLVGEIPDARAAIERVMNKVAIVSSLLALIICSLLITSSINYGLGPLQGLSLVLRQRALDNLSPIELEPEPRELVPVVSSLNNLFERLGAGMERERRFVADAAHELRTPLAVMQLEVQQLQRQLCQSGGEQHNCQRLLEALARTRHSVEQLLLLARLEQGSPRNDRELVDLVELVRRSVADAWSRAEVAGMEIVFETNIEHCQLALNATLKQIAVGNLIDNAIKYGRGPIEVTLSAEQAAVCLCVRDHGEGVDDEVLPRLQEAFFRNHRSDVSGAGLGLSIVSRIIEAEGGSLEPGNHPQGGLQVTIHLPWPSQQQSRSV